MKAKAEKKLSEIYMDFERKETTKRDDSQYFILNVSSKKIPIEFLVGISNPFQKLLRISNAGLWLICLLQLN